MNQAGPSNPAFGADKFGLKDLKSICYNFDTARLVEDAIRRGEAQFAKGGALNAETGIHTGRSPNDKFVVRDEFSEKAIWWDNNKAMTPQAFDALYADMLAHAKGMDLYAQDLYGGADPAHRIKVRVFTEFAWHSLFIRDLLIRPPAEDLASFVADMTILDLPSFSADPARHDCRSQTIIAVNFGRKIVLIGGTNYAGEMKKSVFTYLNYLLPTKNILSMHCSANAVSSGESALFFGLSGTGKTTLSADATRTLIGDDEHGWSPEGIFNFEGGCYAKAINLSAEAEPEIYSTAERFGTIMENVVLDPTTRVPDFYDDSKTENTRIAYPIDFIPNASTTGRASHPRNVIFLACDAFGVLPPIAQLDGSQAMYHFLSGYTALVAGTEKGVTEPVATFSTCFGHPFLPLHPSVYGNLLRDLLAKHEADCWLINTGWTGGIYGVGKRMPIKVTRKLLNAVLDGSLAKVSFRKDPYFGVSVPVSVEGIDTDILDPVRTWSDKQAFDTTAKKLVEMFRKNFAKFEGYVDGAVKAAQPGVAEAA